MKPLNALLNLHEEQMQLTAALMNDCPWENSDFYVEWCAQFYRFVAHATRLLAASAARLTIERDHQHIYFLDHSQEEKHHEKLFEKDLQALGRSASEFSEHPMAAFLYQSQYYLIDYVDPVSLFGSVLFLEGMSISAGPKVYKRLKDKFSDQACNFVRVHVHDDVDHIDKAHKVLSSLSPHELSAITQSYRATSYAFHSLLRDLKAKYAQNVELRTA